MSAGSHRGKTILVTGATSGIGLETARALARSGARVIVGARDADRGAAVARELSGGAEVFSADLASMEQVREAAERFVTSHGALDALVNNAGVVRPRRELSVDGIEVTWQTNFLAPYLLTALLLPALRRAARPRVVNVASRMHARGRIHWEDPGLGRGYGRLRAYAQSKLALVLFTRELARREPGVGANALHPGGIGTKIWRAAPWPLGAILERTLAPAESGARCVARLVSSPELEGVSGRYFDRFRDVAPAPAALDEEDAARLWELAASATGASWPRAAEAERG